MMIKEIRRELKRQLQEMMQFIFDYFVSSKLDIHKFDLEVWFLRLFKKIWKSFCLIKLLIIPSILDF